MKLEDTENWLYEDGEDQPKQVYVDKLAELKVSGSGETLGQMLTLLRTVAPYEERVKHKLEINA